MTVYVDAASNILYSSYYIYGLQQVYGKTNVKFKSKPFSGIRNHDFVLPIILIDKNAIQKIIIDFTDARHIDEEALNWCDKYGKINLHQDDLGRQKIVPIGPSFGIRLYSLFSTFRMAFTNYLIARNRIRNSRLFFSLYKRQWQRLPYSMYTIGRIQEKYIFFISSLWKNEHKANNFRRNFIQACKEIKNIQFEGGFAPRAKNDISGFEKLTTKSRVSLDAYLNKIKLSTLVFNTPAVKDCHGWKLAEYLCLGKAIISTPLTRTLPSDLINKKLILYTDGRKEDIEKCIREIIEDQALLNKLQRNASIYFQNYLSPSSVITNLSNFKPV